MSNRRKPGFTSLYRSGFLASPAWFARRDRWFRDQLTKHGTLACACCEQPAAKSELELHHLDYAGISLTVGKYRALEAHEDLMAMHPHCHELLHRLIDRDPVLSFHRDRRDATTIAIHHLRLTLTQEAS